ncbi:MAG: tetratricopeptide repeat protein [Desulfobacula sp.]|uniref:tetratricopeptide repeat protein n=1 Tax=Desulfobacula sp. TaxID=2593537 RepID=UPI0025C4CCDD|nr:tetratricopeptide repeat protein [Desulfobacula sp.]MCD4721710.1 tetratricopeptide repeat protein [Desulfobacula sp.]
MTTDFSTHQDLKKRWLLAGIAAILVIVLIVPLAFLKSWQKIHHQPNQDIQKSPVFVGRETCKDCHRNEYEKWQNSHHDRAMDIADNSTVLGNFNDITFIHNNITTRLFKKKGAFFVNTIGQDGKYSDFQITHTFGFYPLQQYLVPFDGGRLQCLTIAWDDVKKKWYALPNHTDDHTDWLHWTRQGQNWNGMCAECHSTNLKKGYDIKKDGFNTTWSEIDVSCEACHGPGSGHVAWAETPEMGRREVDNFSLVVKTRNMVSNDFIQICARCHARRASIDDFSHSHKNTMDYMIPSLLTENLYYADGQILEEVYVYGSFMQSKMFLNNVNCSDCHDVHSQKLKIQGNALCLSCHRADTYDTANHHFHKKMYQGKKSKGDDCIQCHMPESVYMGIDKRADHSIRIPRPDLSEVHQTPNACNAAGCHSDKSLEWTNDIMSKWYGKRKRPHFGETIALGRQGKTEGLKNLISLSKDPLFPGIVRATSLSLLYAYPVPDSFTALETALSDPDALVRQTAISTINLLRFDKDAALIFPLLYDPVRAVRIQAALGVASIKNLKLTKNQKKVLDSAIKEYISTMEYSGDFPSGRYNLALMYHALDQTDKAIECYEQSIRIDNLFFPAKNNLAMLYNAKRKNNEAVKLFLQILEDRPQMYDIAYSLGLLLVEEKKYDQAVIFLQKAANGLPGRARIQYNLGLLLQFQKKDKAAEKALLRALSLEPGNFDFLFAMADHYLKRNQLDNALLVAQKMIELFPDNKIGHDILKYANAMK